MSSAPEGRCIASNNLRIRVKANMLCCLSITKYDQKNHKSVGLILVLKHRLYVWLIIYSHNFFGTVLELLE